MARLSGRIGQIEKELAGRCPRVPSDGIALVVIQEDDGCGDLPTPRVERQGSSFNVFVPPGQLERPLDGFLTPEQRSMLLPWVKVVAIAYGGEAPGHVGPGGRAI